MKTTVIRDFGILAVCFFQTVFPADSSAVHETLAPIIITRDSNRVAIDTKELLKKGPVIIWFWNSCCGLKKPQARVLKSLYRSYQGQGLTVIAVNEDDSRKSSGIGTAIKRNQLPFTIVLDKSGDILRQFHTFSVPSVYVIGQDGYIAYSQNGFIAGDEKMLEKKVKALFGDN